MADTKISALTQVTTPAAADMLPMVQGTTNYKITLDMIGNFVEDNFTLTASGSPGAAPAGKMRLFSRSRGGRILPAFVGPSGMDSTVMPHMGGNRFSWWQPLGNATTAPLTTGFPAFTALGTATARNVATTNVLTRMKRLAHVSAATAAALCGIYQNAAAGTQITVGSGAGTDGSGFHIIVRFATSDAAAVAGARMFVGFQTGVAAPTNVEPNTLTNCIGVAQLSTDNTQFYLVWGGSAAQTAIAIGTALGSPDAVNTVYELVLFSAPSNNTTISYQVTNLGTGVTVSGTVSGTAGTQISSSATYGAPRAWRCNNATLAAVGIDIGTIMVETDV